MKRLFSMFMAFFVSLTSNTSFSIVEEKPYTGDYYRVDIEEPPDYRSFYDSQAANTAAENCRTTKYSSNGKKFEGSSNGYWLGNNHEVNLQYLDDHTGHLNTSDRLSNNTIECYVLKDCFSQGQQIIMPFTGELACDSTVSNCTSIQVRCTHPVTGYVYLLTINNMQCWYCDVSRTDALSTSGTLTYHTSEEGDGTPIKAGSVLGIATKDTIVKIVPYGSDTKKVGTATPVQFYSGEYTAYE